MKFFSSKKLSFVIMLLGILFSFFASAQTPEFLNPSTSSSIPEFIKGFYDFALIVAGVLAVGMIIFGGIFYSISGAIDKKNLGKEIIMGALWGLLLILSAYVILRTVNPELVNLEAPALPAVGFNQCTEKEVEIPGVGKKTLPKCTLGEWPLNFETGECECYVDKSWQEEYQKIASEPDSETVERTPGSISSKGRECLKNEFGSTYNEVKSKIVTVNCAGMSIQVHEKAKSAFETACGKIPANTVTACGKPIQNSSDFRWSYIAGSNPPKLSYHAFGIVVDISAWGCGYCDNVRRRDCYAYSTSKICKPPAAQGSCTNTNLPNSVINAFKSSGFGWGGDWINKTDNMHFEWYGPCQK